MATTKLANGLSTWTLVVLFFLGSVAQLGESKISTTVSQSVRRGCWFATKRRGQAGISQRSSTLRTGQSLEVVPLGAEELVDDGVPLQRNSFGVSTLHSTLDSSVVALMWSVYDKSKEP